MRKKSGCSNLGITNEPPPPPPAPRVHASSLWAIDAETETTRFCARNIYEARRNFALAKQLIGPQHYFGKLRRIVGFHSEATLIGRPRYSTG